MSEGKNVIEVKNLRAVVHEEGKDITLLHNSSFVVREGESLGILGESGSGKSTTGRVLAGLLKPDSGAVLIEGEDVYAGSKGRERRERRSTMPRRRHGFSGSSDWMRALRSGSRTSFRAGGCSASALRGRLRAGAS